MRKPRTTAGTTASRLASRIVNPGMAQHDRICRFDLIEQRFSVVRQNHSEGSADSDPTQTIKNITCDSAGNVGNLRTDGDTDADFALTLHHEVV